MKTSLVALPLLALMMVDVADAGNDVLCVDVDAKKIEGLKRGEVPIHEPGLDALIKSNAEAERLRSLKRESGLVGLITRNLWWWFPRGCPSNRPPWQ